MSEEIKAILFDVVHGSYVDGPGTRTTVFLKGCPLRCLWCCNSEGQQMKIELKLEIELCTACGKCYDACSEGALQFSEGKIVSIDRDKCVMCGKCEKACYMDAISTFGKEYTVERLYNELMRDKDYYDATGGGVTIGGGEPTMQPAFTGALMTKLQESGVHVALDTCGYTITDEGKNLLEQADLLLYDVKGLDDQEHIRCTGVSNKIIWENLRRRNEIGKPVIIRMPLIPGCTADKATVKAEAAELSKLDCILRIDIIPYHDFGKNKFKMRGYDYPLEGTPKLSDEEVGELMAILRSHGLTVQNGG